MKQFFSPLWKSSKNRRKQRKYLANAPIHLRGKFLNAHLSKALIQKYGIRSFRLRVGDKVKVMRGQYSGKTGKIDSVDVKTSKVKIDSLFTMKRDGSKSFHPMNSSNIQIEELNLEDKKRKSKLNSLTEENKK